MSSPAAPAPSPWRRTLPTLAVVGYVAALDVWADRGAEPLAWLTGALAILLALVVVRREQPLSRWLGTGVAVVVASLGNVTPHAGVDSFGALGAMTCALAASLALTRIPPDGGIVRPVRMVAWPWAAVLAPLWWATVVARLAPARGDWAWMAEHPRGWTIGAAIVTAAALLAQTEWTLRRRRLELGVAERAMAMRALLATTFVVALVVAFVGRASGDGLARLLVAGASLVVASTAMAKDAVRVARIARRLVALAVIGGSVVLLGASASEGRGWDSWGTTTVVGVILLAIGAGVPYLDGPLRPGRGAWLDAFALASAECRARRSGRRAAGRPARPAGPGRPRRAFARALDVLAHARDHGRRRGLRARAGRGAARGHPALSRRPSPRPRCAPRCSTRSRCAAPSFVRWGAG